MISIWILSEEEARAVFIFFLNCPKG